MFVTLVIQHAKRMRHIVICGLFRSNIYLPPYLIDDTIFGEKKDIEHTMCVWRSSTTFV